MNDSLVETTDRFKEVFEIIRVELRLCDRCKLELLDEMEAEIALIKQRYSRN